ncbi:MULTISPECIES: hypothetical protein [Vibrio]|uniref:Uncharacterized protein n=2 Tax=Vibrio TaxID=662 RepID=A0A510IF06_9VIBR|nr:MULTISPECIES: hypothetical protein [Vibrio]RTZ24585.1 hypothetical protein EKN09_02705 [Vibrio penaeicida]BBL92299.1 hypothetical protein VroAM7_49520 [Vibrio rotiferianus]GLQ71086.1 hypothetical protein GCM10007932_04460 [Vibrio penaeicida]
MQTQIQFQQEMRSQLITQCLVRAHTAISDLQSLDVWDNKQESSRMLNVYLQFCNDTELVADLARVNERDIKLICECYLQDRYQVSLVPSFNEKPCWQELRDFLWLLVSSNLSREESLSLLQVSVHNRVMHTPRLNIFTLSLLRPDLIDLVLVDRLDQHTKLVAVELGINIKQHPLMLED